MEPEILAVLHWLVDQSRPARERLYTHAVDDVVAFLKKHYPADVPPITEPTVHPDQAEPADPRDAELAKLRAENAELAARPVADAAPGYTSVLPPEIPEDQKELWAKFVEQHATAG